MRRGDLAKPGRASNAARVGCRSRARYARDGSVTPRPVVRVGRRSRARNARDGSATRRHWPPVAERS